MDGGPPAGGGPSEVVIRSLDYSRPAAGWPATTIVAAGLPLSRSHRVGAFLTAFATLINTGSAHAVHCRVAPQLSPPFSLGAIV